ncbi:hemin uptake protein HemP [Sulfurospirillum sp. MES]|nr:hemin uptake protein HemP [Sulfurospirillum sp. MES]KHG33993.1 MAG: hemic transporter hemP [Sulfurospirillum sp. MES]
MSNESKKIESKILFGEEKTVTIIHNGNVYILRITKDDKLILTK